MSAKEKAHQAVALLREAVGELVAKNPDMTGIECLRALGIDEQGLVVTVKRLLKVDVAAVLSLAPRPCCGDTA